MTGLEFQKTAIKLYGKRGWQKQVAFALGRDVATIRRWIADDKVPQMAETALKALGEKKDKSRG